MIDVITPDGIAVDIKDAVAEVYSPETVGRLVEVLVKRGILNEDDLRLILPLAYEVRK